MNSSDLYSSDTVTRSLYSADQQFANEPWDAWLERALATGVHWQIASAGRFLIREHAQQGLGPDALGMREDMPLMLELADLVPATAYYTFLGHVYPEPKKGVQDLALVMAAEIFGGLDFTILKLDQERTLARQIWATHIDPARKSITKVIQRLETR